MEYITIFLLILYTFALLVLARQSSIKRKSSLDFLIGGWKVPWVLVTCIILGDWLGASISIGVAQLAYQIGISAASFAFGLGLGLILLALFFAIPLRHFKRITVGEILGDIFDRDIRTISSIILAIAYFVISSAQLVGGGVIVSQLTGCPLNVGIIITTIITVSILLYGGVWSIGFTNVLNVIVLYIGFLAGFIYLISNLGGIYNFLNSLPYDHISILKIDFKSFFAVFITGLLSAFVGQAGLMGVFSSKDPNTARKSTFLAGVLLIPIGLLCTFFGMGARIVFGENLPLSLQALPAILTSFPIALKIMGFISLWALMLSTTGPVLFALTQILTRDIFPAISNNFNKNNDSFFVKKVVIIMAILCTIASFTILEVLQTTMFAYTVRNCLAISIILGIIFGKESWINRSLGVKVGILVGGFVTLSWVLILKRPLDIHEIYPTVLSYLLTVVLVNRYIAKPKILLTEKNIS